MDGISRSRGWDKEIPHGVLPMEQPVLSDKRARKKYLILPMLSYPGCHVMATYIGCIGTHEHGRQVTSLLC